MNDKLLLGAKYYKYDENDNLEIIRIYRHNESEVKAYVNNDKTNKIEMTIEELTKGYVRLEAQAFVIFSIVKVGNGLDDVIVSMHRMADLASNEPIPYCVCRQNITDIFANQIRVSNKMYVGCCMSLDTCPPDIDYSIMISCNGISKSVTVCTYMNDTLDDIMYFIKTKDFDRSLESLFVDHVNYETKENAVLSAIKHKILKLDTYDGYCKSLRLLLDYNNFMYDYYRGFNIIPINEELTYDEETGVVSQNVVDIISDLYQINIKSTLCIKYDHDIDLDSIDNTYCLIMDNTDTLYVVAYVSNGSKHIEIENIESDENIEKLINSTLSENKSIKEVAERLRLNKSKYNN